jgi:hypothetical protein
MVVVMMDFIMKERRMDKVNIYGQMAVIIMVIGIQII